MGADWPSVRVSDLVGARVLVVNDGYRVRNEELGPVGIPFVRGGDIGGGGIDTSVEDHIRPELAGRVTQKLSQPGDVAFITKGTVGRVGYLRDDQPPVVFAPQVAYWRVLDREHLSPRWLFYLLLGPEFQANLDAVKTHGAMVADYVSISQQLDFRLTIPPLPEQRAIASVLGAIDDKIALNRRLNDTLEETARALFKSWFVDFDPVRAKAEGRQPFGMDAATAALFPNGCEDSELGAVPSGWAVEPLDGIAKFLNGLALQKHPPVLGRPTLPVIKIAQLRAGRPNPEELADAALPSQYVIEDGDLIFSWSGSLLVDIWCAGRGALNQHLFKVTSERFPKWFFKGWLDQHLQGFQGIAADKATTMGHIQRHHLTEAKVVVPPSTVIAHADAVFTPLIERMVASRVESRTLAGLRDYLLPRLLSGEVRAAKVMEAA